MEFFAAEEMDVADEELRETIRMIWPLQAKKMMDLLVPKIDVLNKFNLTVGRIYAGLLILESWRSTRFGKKKSRFGVSLQTSVVISHIEIRFSLCECINSLRAIDSSCIAFLMNCE